jgi:hypothetical protein
MLPNELKADQFSAYPPQARQIAVSHIGLFQSLPLAFLPLLLRELAAYDWKFPAERKDLDNQLAYLSALSSEQLAAAMAPLANLRLSADLARVDWVNAPAQFSEQLTAHLWTTHQIDAFRTAAIDYVHKVNAAAPSEPLPVPRLSIIVMGAGVAQNRYPLFRKLRSYGVYFNNVNPDDGWSILSGTLAARAAAHPVPFAHWYIDGAVTQARNSAGLTCISYDALSPIRTALVTKMRQVMQPGGGGPEVLRTMLAQLRPEELGLNGTGDAAVLNRFQVSILTEGSGTQLFSTTFVQWSAREALRRAQPVTLLARFAPRQREESMQELLAGRAHDPIPDPEGSLIDADMAAYYTWINMQRLTGAGQSSFLVWFENHRDALAISPALPRGKNDETAIDMPELIRRLT